MSFITPTVWLQFLNRFLSTAQNMYYNTVLFIKYHSPYYEGTTYKFLNQDT